MNARATDSFRDQNLSANYSNLLVVCCGYVSNLIGRRTINIPEIILGVHGLMGFTVNYLKNFFCFELFCGRYMEKSFPVY